MVMRIAGVVIFAPGLQFQNAVMLDQCCYWNSKRLCKQYTEVKICAIRFSISSFLEA